MKQFLVIYVSTISSSVLASFDKEVDARTYAKLTALSEDRAESSYIVAKIV